MCEVQILGIYWNFMHKDVISSSTIVQVNRDDFLEALLAHLLIRSFIDYEIRKKCFQSCYFQQDRETLDFHHQGNNTNLMGPGIHYQHRRSLQNLFVIFLTLNPKPIPVESIQFTLYLYLAHKGYREMGETLIRHMADVNFQNASGKNSLMMACYAGEDFLNS